MTSPRDQRAAVIEAVKAAHKMLSQHHLMSSLDLAQLERVALALSDLDRGIVGSLTRPAPRTRRGRPERDGEEVLLIAAARALGTIYAEKYKLVSSHRDVADMLDVRGYRLRDGSRISPETVRGWRNVKDPRVLALAGQITPLETESPGMKVREILRFIGMRVTRHALPKPKDSN